MNIRISMVIFILLSFLNIGAISNNTVNTKNSFSALETNMKSVSEFKENGVKLQYRTKDNIKEEIFRIKEYLISSIDGKYRELGNNEFEIINNDFDINVKLWDEDEYSYGEIILTNRNSKYTTADLKNILQKIEDSKSENIQYFVYFEGKGNGIESNYFINRLINQNNIEKAKFLDINDGYTGTGYLSNGDRVNFALTKYNTGSYIIIGTPIIFTTY